MSYFGNHPPGIQVWDWNRWWNGFMGRAIILLFGRAKFPDFKKIISSSLILLSRSVTRAIWHLVFSRQITMKRTMHQLQSSATALANAQDKKSKALEKIWSHDLHLESSTSWQFSHCLPKCRIYCWYGKFISDQLNWPSVTSCNAQKHFQFPTKLSCESVF